MHDRIGKRVSVHDRLGGRTMLRDPAGRSVPAHDRLEQMADERVQDDQPMRRDPEREPDRRSEGSTASEPYVRKKGVSPVDRLGMVRKLQSTAGSSSTQRPANFLSTSKMRGLSLLTLLRAPIYVPQAHGSW